MNAILHSLWMLSTLWHTLRRKLLEKKMPFPSWVSEPADQTPQELASKRLQYLISKAALATVPGGTISAFADFCLVDRTTIYNYISAGSFSARTATKIERAVGRSILSHEALMYPLEIAESAA
jgi:hypothetical protein